MAVLRWIGLLLAAVPLLTAPARAHDIPIDAVVRMFVKPQGQVLRVLVRMPLKSTTEDLEYPRRERDFVDLTKLEPFLRDAAQVALLDSLDVYEDGKLLPKPRIASVRMSLESDPSFSDYDSALAHVLGPKLPDSETLYWEQGILDVLFEYPIRSERSYFSIHAAFNRLALHEVTTVQFLAPGALSRVYELEGDAGLVHLDPSWFHAAGRFVVMGFDHILDGTDHLLFLLCLVIPFRRVRPLIPIVTAFTVAHSITLIASTYGYVPDVLWFAPLIETLIAMSIFYMALENIVVQRPMHRWIITFCFGLVHGFGFSFGLQHSLQFAGSHLLTSLLSFNVGVELGQLLVLCLFVPALNLLFRYVVSERMGVIIVSAIVAHQAWHWMVDRFAVLQRFPWPKITTAGVRSGLGWLSVAVVMAALLWLTSLAIKGWTESEERELPKSY
jgi:HupE / UreJ protein